MKIDNLADAIESLREREGTLNKYIGIITQDMTDLNNLQKDILLWAAKKG